jgi:transglutaminase superfamily protein
MRCLFPKALWQLIVFDFYLLWGNFAALYKKVEKYPLHRSGVLPGAVERICSAVDLACIWYPKRALCLQRSAATTCLLRSYGVPAQMVIGTQKLPFKAHAWVEVDEQVVNDKPYTREMYAVLGRC